LRVRDDAGRLIDLGWGKAAAAWIPLRDFDMEHVLALAEKVDDDGIGKEIWRKVRSFLKQLIDYAKLRNDYPRDRANPVTLVPAPAQTGVRLVRRPYLPEIVEEIRSDFLELEALFHAGVRRARGRLVEIPAGVPVPPVAGFGQISADLVAIAYGGFRPGEILAVLGRHYAPADLGRDVADRCAPSNALHRKLNGYGSGRQGLRGVIRRYEGKGPARHRRRNRGGAERGPRDASPSGKRLVDGARSRRDLSPKSAPKLDRLRPLGRASKMKCPRFQDFGGSPLTDSNRRPPL
jgi:hypothetical protein